MTAVPEFAGLTLVDLLRWRAAHEPDTRGYTFLADGEEKECFLTFDELDRRARAVAALIRSVGAEGQALLLVFPSGLEFISAFFGCLYAGSTVVAVHPPRPNRSLDRFAAVARDSEVKFILTLEAIRIRTESTVADIKEFEYLKWLSIDSVDENDAEKWVSPDIDGTSVRRLG